MDKLEKALHKARQERNYATATTVLDKDSRASTLNRGQAFARTVSLSNEVLDQNRIIAHLTRSKEADIFRLLRTQVLQSMNKENWRTLAITSPNYGEGKTTIALNLAVSISMDLKQTVLVVDLDFRKPSIEQYLGLPPAQGLTDYLLGAISIPEAMIRLPFERLTLLPAGTISENSSEIIGSPRMAELARELKLRYPDRFIIYDMPPLLTQDDPLTFLPHADAALLVLQEGVTKREEILRCHDLLRHTNVIGTVLNDCV